MIKTTNEILTQLKELTKDMSDDTTLKFIEDVTDTLNDKDKVDVDSVNKEWEEKYNTLDSEWRNKYKERFFTQSEENEKKQANADSEKEAEENKTYKYDDLFKSER